MRKGQGAVEYIIILGVIILIALIVVGSLGGFGIFDFSQTATQRTNEISNLLADVGLKWVIGSNGAVQVSIRSQTSESVVAHNMSITNSSGGSCWILMNNEIVRQQYKSYSNTSCGSIISGTAGEAYSFICTLKYQDSSQIEHSKVGSCSGTFESL